MDRINHKKAWFSDWNNIFDLGLSKHALLVRLYLARCADSNEQAFPSLNTIAKKCGMGKSSVAEALKELEQRELVHREARLKIGTNENTSTLYTLLSPCPEYGQPPVLNTDNVVQRADTKNTNLKRLNSKVSYAEFVNMSTKEYDTLVSKHGEPFTLKCIEVLDNHKGAKGIKYVSDYRAILTWVEDAVRKKHPEVINKLANAVTDVQTTRDLLKRIEGGANDAQQRIGGEIDDWLSNS